MKKILLSLWAVLNLVLWTGCSNDEGPQPSLELANPDAEFVLGADRNAMLAVSFTSTSDWQASTNVSWAVPSPQRGTAGAATLNLLASTKNDTGNNRQGVLTIKAGELTLTVKFTQSVMPVITTGQDVYPVPAAGGAFTLDYQTNLTGPFTLLTADGNSVDWVQTAPESRTMQNGELTLQVAKNPYDNERSAQLILQGTDENGATVSSNTFTLTQAARSVGTSQSMADDKQVYQLQTHSEGNGVPLVLMGDGFLDTDISSGYYEQAMQQAMENLFTEEPYRSLRDLFDVWMVTAVSRNNAFTSGYSTAFSSQVDALNGNANSTLIAGDDEKVMAYAQLVPELAANPDLFEEALCIVVLNSTVYAGTCWFGFNNAGQVMEFAVCYCPMIYGLEDDMFRRVLCHEAGGHGFAKLMDEYSYQEMGAMPESEIQTHQTWQEELGWAMNVDFTPNSQEVVWSRFLYDERYQGADAYGETLGIYQGACTYWSGAYRPTNESMMRSNKNGFNAPSREAIYKRIMKLAYGDNWNYDYEEFVAFDQAHLPQPVGTQTKAADGGTKPFAAPRFAGRPLIYARP
ncbi:MAG TPA: hypothetical protein H9785_11260 [Candidatus Bacteroides intestinavium]|uniref:BACON domain-containing protein n=1 Tax=Candidatus Bacteroides intestinavium TaxID=2838469 RepID=A0A9D2KU08_9BACE|nr:hypothetical protein [Candidatus Bacteroides intestinavium]